MIIVTSSAAPIGPKADKEAMPRTISWNYVETRFNKIIGGWDLWRNFRAGFRQGWALGPCTIWFPKRLFYCRKSPLATPGLGPWTIGLPGPYVNPALQKLIRVHTHQKTRNYRLFSRFLKVKMTQTFKC